MNQPPRRPVINLASIFNGLLSLSPCDEAVGVQHISAAPHNTFNCCGLYLELTFNYLDILKHTLNIGRMVSNVT